MAKEFVRVIDISELRPGDIIRNLSESSSLIVTANYGNRATAVRTTDVTNAPEWTVMREVSR